MVIVVQICDQHLQRGVQLDSRGLDLFHYGLKEGFQVVC